MKKNNVTLVVFLLVGIILGSILTKLLGTVDALHFLAKSSELSWEPKADLDVIRYDISLHIRLNLFTIIGILAAVWAYRKW